MTPQMPRAVCIGKSGRLKRRGAALYDLPLSFVYSDSSLAGPARLTPVRGFLFLGPALRQCHLPRLQGPLGMAWGLAGSRGPIFSSRSIKRYMRRVRRLPYSMAIASVNSQADSVRGEASDSRQLWLSCVLSLEMKRRQLYRPATC